MKGGTESKEFGRCVKVRKVGKGLFITRVRLAPCFGENFGKTIFYVVRLGENKVSYEKWRMKIF